MSTWETVITILGLTVITVLTRSFFLIPERELPLPAWLKQGLRYAPLHEMIHCGQIAMIRRMLGMKPIW